MILVSKKLATSEWIAIDVGSPNITGVKIRMKNTNIAIHNIYCNCSHSGSMREMKRHLREEEVSEMVAAVMSTWFGSGTSTGTTLSGTRNKITICSHVLEPESTMPKLWC